jgi:hypothetical protein
VRQSNDIITDIRCTDLCFSRTQTPSSAIFARQRTASTTPRARSTRYGSGPVALTLVEVETAGGEIGHGTIGGFTSSGTEIVETYLKPLALSHSVYETELLWDKLYRAPSASGGAVRLYPHWAPSTSRAGICRPNC